MEWDAWKGRWPNAHASRFVRSGPHLWHVQVAGSGPVLLCLHGTGAATHTWRDMLPILARDWTVVAPDLPGHGFTRMATPMRSGIGAMADDLAHLCRSQDWPVHAILGHSAGAALALEMSMRAGAAAPSRVIAINAALGAFPGLAGVLFPATARILATFRALPRTAARLVSRDRVRSALGATGSRVDTAGLDLYTGLFQDAAHVDGAIQMMARWSTRSVADHLASIEHDVTLIVGTSDGTVPPDLSREAAARLRHAKLVELPGGHLVHEERPEETADLIGPP